MPERVRPQRCWDWLRPDDHFAPRDLGEIHDDHVKNHNHNVKDHSQNVENYCVDHEFPLCLRQCRPLRIKVHANDPSAFQPFLHFSWGLLVW